MSLSARGVKKLDQRRRPSFWYMSRKKRKKSGIEKFQMNIIPCGWGGYEGRVGQCWTIPEASSIRVDPDGGERPSSRCQSSEGVFARSAPRNRYKRGRSCLQALNVGVIQAQKKKAGRSQGGSPWEASEAGCRQEKTLKGKKGIGHSDRGSLSRWQETRIGATQEHGPQRGGGLVTPNWVRKGRGGRRLFVELSDRELERLRIQYLQRDEHNSFHSSFRTRPT